jgi:cellulose synthase/poly-beta-1,6-N-acetylglucosamine synthase-like glycosyltransferase
MKLCILVPVYQEPKFLADIVAKLHACGPAVEREIVAVIDGAMTPPIAAALEALGSSVAVEFPNEHRGKAAALNRAAAGREADALLFLDNDVQLPEGGQFLDVLCDLLERSDLVEMPKEVLVESWYSAMIGYEYQNLALANLILARVVGRSPGVIGAAFAVKKALFDRLGGFRAVVHEDGDFAARAFRVRARFSFDFRLKIKTSMPNTLADWVKQRKRWTMINVLWFRENFLHIVGSAFVQPALIPAAGLLLLPSILSLVLFFALKNLNLAVLGPFVFIVGQPLQVVSGVLLWFSYNQLFAESLLSLGLGFAVSAVLFGGFALKYRFHFNLLSFAAYFFLYLPLLVVINLAMFVALLIKRPLKLDWRT